MESLLDEIKVWNDHYGEESLLVLGDRYNEAIEYTVYVDENDDEIKTTRGKNEFFHLGFRAAVSESHNIRTVLDIQNSGNSYYTVDVIWGYIAGCIIDKDVNPLCLGFLYGILGESPHSDELKFNEKEEEGYLDALYALQCTEKAFGKRRFVIERERRDIKRFINEKPGTKFFPRRYPSLEDIDREMYDDATAGVLENGK